MSSRRGFTLVELAVALVLGLLVGAIIHRTLLQGQRLARAQFERLALNENVRVAALVLAGELGGLGYAESIRSDLLAVAPGAVTYLAGRGGGYVCGVLPGPAAQVVVEESSWESPRAPRATDSLLVFAESNPATGSDDAWIHLGIVSVAAGSCPGGAAGIAIQVAVPGPLDPAWPARVTPGSPARLAEVMQMRYYESGGRSWFGMRSVSTGEAIAPVAGPLADSTSGVRGLTLAYRDAADGPTWDPEAVRAVEIALLGVTSQAIHGRVPGRALVDSLALTTRVAPRNALRP
jgi:prepilin-type N-terminal cleavage/methylation domain-containing protein